jgi:ribosomal protein S18 acetylase RimI-like enzyme
LDVELLVPTDWKDLRTVRLRALIDSPSAFLSTHELELGWTEPQWRSTFEQAFWVVARHGAEIVGLARCLRETGGDPHERYVESLWVEPGHRRSGITRMLLQRVLDAVRLEAVEKLLLWVLDGNREARVVYERLGFGTTNRRQALPDDPDRSEELLCLDVDEGLILG